MILFMCFFDRILFKPTIYIFYIFLHTKILNFAKLCFLILENIPEKTGNIKCRKIKFLKLWKYLKKWY